MKKIYPLTIIIVAILLITQMFINNSLATKGQEVHALQNQINQLKDVNRQLSQQRATHQSLDQVASQAAQLGFVPAQQQKSIILPPPLAWIGSH